MNKQNTTLRRWALVIMAGFVAWHMFATFLWISPNTPLRDVVPKAVLHGYMSPLFSQAWSVFAPEPINADYYLDVRAQIETDGEITTTEWVRPTDVEASLVRHNLAPSRAGVLATDITNELYSEFRDLEDDVEEVVGWNWHEEDWSSRLAARLDDEGAVVSYIRAERFVNAYATQVAYAVWGDDVIRIQYKVSRHPVIPFAERDNPEAERPEPITQFYGWRGVSENEGQSREQFRDYFCAAPRSLC